jgi:hypothetical protein
MAFLLLIQSQLMPHPAGSLVILFSFIFVSAHLGLPSFVFSSAGFRSGFLTWS